jgi:hypothetical protein
MRIRLSEPSLLSELRQHFERSGFVVLELDAETIEVTHPDAPSEQQSERGVESHLAIWRVIHPEAHAESSISGVRPPPEAAPSRKQHNGRAGD